MIFPGQSRAARGLLEWSQTNLAEAAGVSLSTVRDFESGKRTPVPNNLRAMVDALEKAGVILIPENGEGAGVRLRKDP
ncbi:helix-turn-helix domain-containing protein [Antarcticirhabdus aurantiaca]|uniref:Helix-turn-helix transcriptional regulator n=1 Tax=Antarcticirhabdus aurantiaca TaxID=2606717 RepID=A0ACD4NKT9_9HYPH|nr:helix-turn-helix transcriptional regulator [Antarcticirhabdus aurantiaca]WAJ27397.1 helix-turn-helix transcriptional regulator [Jeongeuplla avenae]